ncbi:MAG: hypothetical protein GX616_02385 [Planctomycetes bacterium]|nr:hypothetical protein [Planctomycetota bacterium]
MRTTSSIVAAAVFLAGSTVVWASRPEPGHMSRHGTEADIEDLDAEIRWDGEKWRLSVEYDVEIENAGGGESFDLVLSLFDKRGRNTPVQITVQLVQPTEVDDNEVEYESTVEARIDASLVGDPTRLRLRGMVVYRGGGIVLDEKETSVDHKR